MPGDVVCTNTGEKAAKEYETVPKGKVRLYVHARIHVTVVRFWQCGSVDAHKDMRAAKLFAG